MSREFSDQLALAALSDVDTGELARPISAAEWYVPTKVWREDSRLHWETDGPKNARAGKGMLERFLRLAAEDGNPDDVLNFAQRWGVLDICTNHGLPGGHPLDILPADDPSRSVLSCRAHRKPSLLEGHYSEPIKAWRRYAGQMGAVLRSLGAIRVDRLPTEPDCELLFPGGLDMDSLTPTVALRLTSSLVVDPWINWGRVRPYFDPDIHSAKITLGGRGLFGALVTQLIFASAGTSFAVCSSCGTPYRPARQPAIGRNNFCGDCGRRASNRLSQRERRRSASTQSVKRRPNRT